MASFWYGFRLIEPSESNLAPIWHGQSGTNLDSGPIWHWPRILFQSGRAQSGKIIYTLLASSHASGNVVLQSGNKGNLAIARISKKFRWSRGCTSFHTAIWNLYQSGNVYQSGNLVNLAHIWYYLNRETEAIWANSSSNPIWNQSQSGKQTNLDSGPIWKINLGSYKPNLVFRSIWQLQF